MSTSTQRTPKPLSVVETVGGFGLLLVLAVCGAIAARGLGWTAQATALTGIGSALTGLLIWIIARKILVAKGALAPVMTIRHLTDYPQTR